MSNVYQMPERRYPIDEAGDWLAKLDRGLNEQEEAALREWLAADPRNPMALMESASVWDKMDSLSRLAELFPQPVARSADATAAFPASSRGMLMRVAYAIAATVVIAMLAGYWAVAYYTPESSIPAVAEDTNERIFQTAVGEYSTVMLADGSQVTLNTNSLVRARSTARRRMLSLERGEVYVQVAHDPSRPFSVWVGDRLVEAVGTAFSVAITEDQRIELIVTEGKVVVGLADKKPAKAPEKFERAPAPPEPAGVANSAVTVSAGERLVLDEDSGKVEAVEPEELEVRLSWRGGNLVFRGESLAEALAEIERYTRVEFVIQDEALKKVRIVGMFKAGDVDGLLATLRQNFDIAYQRVSEEKVILTNSSAHP
ncbi:MAG: FecR domain-containing protein [Gammaproteobacteria bacterium]|nr:FecR domain-containing protein [Gammaproteobacteria bacterium]